MNTMPDKWGQFDTPDIIHIANRLGVDGMSTSVTLLHAECRNLERNIDNSVAVRKLAAERNAFNVTK